MNARGLVEVPAERVKVADTVGAGDTFQAALLAWMFREHGLKAEALQTLDSSELTELLSFAAKAASITCSRAGCNPPWQHELGSNGGSRGPRVESREQERSAESTSTLKAQSAAAAARQLQGNVLQ